MTNQTNVAGASIQSIVHVLLVSDYGHFEAMRKAHPIKLNEVIEGKRVVMTCWEWSPDSGDKPIFRLDGESKTRTVS